jgi:hypothetical protein
MTTRSGRAFGFMALALVALGPVAVGPGAFGAVSRAATPGSVPGERVLARVGETAINERDVALRMAVLAARGAVDSGPQRATVELLREALASEVARNLGLAASAADVAELDRHAASTSRDPELLARLRDSLGSEFARQVLEPRLVLIALQHRFESARSGSEAAAFDAWYREHATAVVVAIDDPVASDVCATYPGVWWLQQPCRRALDHRGGGEQRPRR